MSQRDVYQWVEILLIYSVLGFVAVSQIRYLVRRYRRNRWPTTEGTIQKGAFGRVSTGKGGAIPANFMGYSYVIDGVRYAGFFALISNEMETRSVESSLVGRPIQIRYDPTNPSVSLLADYKDPRFNGMTATQNPEMLDNAPSFDLQDAIRGPVMQRKAGDE